MDNIDIDNLGTFLSGLTTAAVVVATTWSLNSYRKKNAQQAELDQWIARARQERNDKQHKALLKDEGVSGNFPLLTVAQTRDMILARNLDPAGNVLAHAKRCRRYGRNEEHGVNAIAEEFYDEAYETAKSLDLAEINLKTAPPLYGVPISIKECLALKGAYSTGGMACRLNRRMSEDGLIVQLLKQGGAIPLCTGNTVQLMFLFESVNRIWGQSRNPWDLTRTPGGSSGGDAALVAMGAVPIAACSDVAGSIRIPACFCGLVGFKPTPTRMSAKGNMKPRLNDRIGTAIAIPATVGPIARTVEDSTLFMKAVWTPEFFRGDLNVTPLCFNEKTYNSTEKLKIGYYKTDHWFEPCVTARRALDETIAALEEAGHTCVPFDIPTDGWHNYHLLASINGAEGNFRSYLEAVEGEKLIDQYKMLVIASNLPNWIRWIARLVLDKRRAHLMTATRSGGFSSYDLWQKAADLLEMRAKWSEAFLKAGVDAVIHPGFPIPAIPHGISGDLTASVSYMFTANLLLWPAGVVPVTTVREDEQQYRMEDLPANQRDVQAKLTAKVMENSAGLPIGVSVMAPAFQDETCLRVMKEIEALVNFKEEATAYKDFSTS